MNRPNVVGEGQQAMGRTGAFGNIVSDAPADPRVPLEVGPDGVPGAVRR